MSRKITIGMEELDDPHAQDLEGEGNGLISNEPRSITFLTAKTITLGALALAFILFVILFIISAALSTCSAVHSRRYETGFESDLGEHLNS
jgi:hypothetical protein